MSDPQNPKPTPRSESWATWGSPVGLGLFLVACGVLFWVFALGLETLSSIG